jgi:hypothetical protein
VSAAARWATGTKIQSQTPTAVKYFRRAESMA